MQAELWGWRMRDARAFICASLRQLGDDVRGDLAEQPETPAGFAATGTTSGVVSLSPPCIQPKRPRAIGSRLFVRQAWAVPRLRHLGSAQFAWQQASRPALPPHPLVVRPGAHWTRRRNQTALGQQQKRSGAHAAVRQGQLKSSAALQITFHPRCSLSRHSRTPHNHTRCASGWLAQGAAQTPGWYAVLETVALSSCEGCASRT